MDLKSNAGPINVFVINQNAGSSGPVSSFSPQCPHNNTLTSACSTTGVLEEEAVGHLHEHHKARTINLGMATVSQSTETEVTSAISGSIVTPAVTQQDSVSTITDQTIADLLNEIPEMSQDDSKLIPKKLNVIISIQCFSHSQTILHTRYLSRL